MSGLPAGVTAAFSQTVGDAPAGPVASPTGSTTVTLTLTESGDTLIPANFTVTATAEDAPEITLSTPGQLTLRDESILVAGVATNPPFTNPGGQVDVTAQIQSVVNEPTAGHGLLHRHGCQRQACSSPLHAGVGA